MNDAAVAETHISVLLFLGDRVYKLKKPVRYGFIDLSTRQARERICHREVELNRRLAPDVYLGVLDVVDQRGRAVDHVVEMRRLPADRRLATLIREGEDVGHCLRDLAHQLAAFHQAAPTSADIAAAGNWEAVCEKWTENFEEMERFVDQVLDDGTFARVRSLADRYLSGRRALFKARAASGRIRDGHGDLMAEDIFCLDDGPRALDCIEFDDRLRYGDVVADVAFLAMDLERLGAPDKAEYFLRWYRDFSGETYPDSLAHFYIAFRAVIRSKVACLSFEQGNAAKRSEATAHLELAQTHLAQGRVRLVLIGGLPGTGKSTLAQSLAERTGWTVIRSDEVRKELAGMSHQHHEHETFGTGLYSDEMTRQTYAELAARAKRMLSLGESVVLDASWSAVAHRRAAHAVAEETSSDLYELRCVVDAREAADRMRRRAARANDASDADERVAETMAARMDPWPAATDIDTLADPATCVAQAGEITSTVGPAGRSRSGTAHDARIGG